MPILKQSIPTLEEVAFWCNTWVRLLSYT
jgi:hypothetical protein